MTEPSTLEKLLKSQKDLKSLLATMPNDMMIAGTLQKIEDAIKRLQCEQSS